MICIIALLVFGILGIFSAAHRKLAKEALDCVARRVVLRPCETGFDQRIKSLVVGKFLRFPWLARPLYRHFEIFSWLFLILSLGSIFFSVQGIYNYAAYGNCNGDEGGFCIFDPQDNRGISFLDEGKSSELKNPGIDDDPSLGPENAPITLIEFGCFKCPYTRKAEEVLWRILDDYKDEIRFVYRDFPLSASHIGAMEPSIAAECVLEQSKAAFWEYRRILFENQYSQRDEDLFSYTGLVDIDRDAWLACFESEKYVDEIQQDYEDGLKAGIYGTPTFFINNETLVGPQSYRTFKKVIERELKKARVA